MDTSFLKKKQQKKKTPTTEDSCSLECWVAYNISGKQSLLIFSMLLLSKIKLPYHWYQREIFKKTHKSATLAVEKLKKKHHKDHC